MKIETVALEDQQTRVVAELDVETFERFKRQAARKMSQSAKIPGFRPGKAPYDVIRRMYGDEAIQQEAVELMLDEVYPQVLKEANLNPSGMGKLDEIVSMDPPTFAFVVPLPPQVEPGEYKSIQKEYAPEPVTDEQVEHTLMHLRRSYSTAEPVERAAQAGDSISFKLSAKRLNPAEGEDETLIAEMPYQMIAGEDEQEGEPWPYPGFSHELVGLSADETKTFTHAFPEDSDFEDLRGKEAEFTVTVQNVKEMHLPELNDDFAQSLGQFETLEDLRKAVQQQLEQNYKQQYDQKFYDELIDELVAQSTVKYPPHMLDEEIEDFIHNLGHSLERDRLDLETYLKMREMDRETFTEQEVKPAAERRLVRSLVLEEIARRENIEVKNEEVRAIFNMAMQQSQAQGPSQGRAKNQPSPREMANSIAVNAVNNIFNQRLMARLKALATGQEEEKDELSALSEEMEAVDLAGEENVLEVETTDADVEAADVEVTEAEESPAQPAVADSQPSRTSTEASAVFSEEAADGELESAVEDYTADGINALTEQAAGSDEPVEVPEDAAEDVDTASHVDLDKSDEAQEDESSQKES